MLVGKIGQIAIMILMLASLSGITIHICAMKTHSYKWRRLSKTAMGVQLILASVASLSLVWLLITENLNYAYVADYTSAGLSLIYKIAAFWAGNAGSLLLWTFVITLYGWSVTLSKHEDSDKMQPIVSMIMTAIILFFAVILNFNANPFSRLPEAVLTGNGLSPLLQNPGMIVHPVNIYLGYIGFSVPFAFAMAALFLGKIDATWLRVTRQWTLVSWLFLSIGIIYGAHWSYEELGWGGYWAWDPVENASLLPWLTSTAFLHSAMVWEKRGMLKRWNVVLVTLTFLLTTFGTFLTRSGVIWSIHAFSNASLGGYFITFLIVTILFSASLIIWRWQLLVPDRTFEGMISKESGFALHNILLLGVTFAVMWGTIYPIISRMISGRQMMVAPSFYNSVTLPLSVAIIALMGIGPTLLWKKDKVYQIGKRIGAPAVIAVALALWLHGSLFVTYHHTSTLGIAAFATSLFVILMVVVEFACLVKMSVKSAQRSILQEIVQRFCFQRRRLGGLIVHGAIAFLAIGITGSGIYHVDIEQQLSIGQTVQIAHYQLMYEGTGVVSGTQTKRLFANLVVRRGDKEIGVMRPAVTFYMDGQAPGTNVSIYSRPFSDLYVVLLGTDRSDRATLDFHVNPLVQFIWFGGYLFVLGALVSLWPQTIRGR